MNKRFLSLALAGVLTLGLLTACGGNQEPAPETDTPAVESPSPETETPAPETETPAPETETPAPETETPEAPETEAPAEVRWYFQRCLAGEVTRE